MGDRVKRVGLLVGVLLVLVVVGNTTYALYQPKTEVKGCVNVFKEIEPLNEGPRDVSYVEVFAKILLSNDIGNLAKPWEINYRGVKAAKHEVKYKGEKIEMLAIGLPLKNGKVLVYYEFLNSVRGIKSVSYLFSVNGSRIKTETVSINGHVTTLDNCPQECSKDSDCPYYPMEECVMTCCDYHVDTGCIVECCGPCAFACTRGTIHMCILCFLTYCPWCADRHGCADCLEWGTTCEEADWD